MPYHVYILASRKNGTLYVGSTSDILTRIWQHKNKIRKGFTERYDVTQLVHLEEFEDARLMAQREKRLKEWKRAWKIHLIETHNPQWEDLYEKLFLNNLIGFINFLQALFRLFIIRIQVGVIFFRELFILLFK